MEQEQNDGLSMKGLIESSLEQGHSTVILKELDKGVEIIELEMMLKLWGGEKLIAEQKVQLQEALTDVSDLLDYITPDADQKAREAQKKARAKLKGKPGQNWETASDENQKDEDMSKGYSITETTSDKENKSESQIKDNGIDIVESSHIDLTMLNESNNLAQDDSSDEGWQEAVPKGRSLTGRKSSSSRRPTLAKLNTNFMNASQSRYRGKPTNFSSPRTNLNETAVAPSPLVPKKFVKSASFSPKLNSGNVPDGGTEKLADSKSAPASPAPSDQIPKPAPSSTGVGAQSAVKLYSYKEVALAPPGTIVKAVAEQPPKGNPIQQNSEVSAMIVATKETGNIVATNDVEDGAQKSIDEKQQNDVHEDQKERETTVVNDNTETVNRTAEDGVAVKIQDASIVSGIQKETEVGNITVVEVENSGCFDNINNSASKCESEIQVQESCQATSQNLNPLTILVEDEKQLLENDACELIDTGNEGDEKLESSSHNVVCKSLPSEGEKQETETGKEPTKKLSAAAPPFNPSTIPVFGSVPVPGFKDHGGILPPPVNIAPLLPVSPRRSPHQSATARVPYGPRISGGYNRYGNRVPRNKTVFLSGEPSPDGNPNSPPRIMNPHATEFVPAQHWVSNGYVVPPNGYMASPNGIPGSPNSFPPVSHNGTPVSPSGYPASLNGIQVNQNGFAPSPTISTDSSQVVYVETDLENKSQTPDEENKDAFSTDGCSENNLVEQNPQELSASNENSNPKVEERQADLSPPSAFSTADKVTKKEAVDQTTQNKCWGDYSDSEADMIEVSS
ncbi:unnamed protein product [Sphenostylis stenocarpa]|uniref:Uncharacterized protein n=1 Tax=Sphenostylis stenocarpa TaxID=92480 RepID=A0AA86SZ22_9FABA|nr:unnamed protein product [Sphenostylis stenocarpa]